MGEAKTDATDCENENCIVISAL